MAVNQMPRAEEGQLLWPEVGSSDFLKFDFGGTAYESELQKNQARAKNLSAIKCMVKTIGPLGGSVDEALGVRVMWMEHDFAFFGGSLGCAEGEKLTRGFEYAKQHGLPVVVKCASGGARMHEGTLSLMQMAKISCAVAALGSAGLPFLTLLVDPCYGGVSASYAMQADVRIGAARGRLGFSGPQVILNTQFSMHQDSYDRTCPDEFQSNEFGLHHGVVDVVVPPEDMESVAWQVLSVLAAKPQRPPSTSTKITEFASGSPDYLKSRGLDRYDSTDILKQLSVRFIDLGGDGKGPHGLDKCLRCGLATLQSGRSVVVMRCCKGHTPVDREKHNHAMPAPAGYRTALRFFDLAERFGLPVVTLVDTVGAWPSFAAEMAGQSEAIATNLTKMGGLKVPIVTIIVGEGGSGGALAIAMGNKIGMLSKAYYSTITPEGAASILGRYKDDDHKKVQFPEDCMALASKQNIYAPQLKELGVIDEVIWEKDGEDCNEFPATMSNISAFVEASLQELADMDQSKLVEQRYQKFRNMGKFKEYSPEEREALTSAPAEQKSKRQRSVPTPPKLLTFLTEQTMKGDSSFFKGKGPKDCPRNCYLKVEPEPAAKPERNAKQILDEEGPEAMAKWVRATSKERILVTDTTLRDAHQSLVATRMRTADMLKAAPEMSKHLHQYFSLECWGGATFDVAYRFLNEDAFRRLEELRAAIPNICTQMLLRGANGVGYKSYPDNVVEEFVRQAATSGMDVFRIFDCFNDVEQMKVSINAVRKMKKVAEIAMCFTGDFLSPDEKIYTLDYYKDLCQKCVDAGAHMIAIKDMAGLLRPAHAAPMIQVIRSVTDLPIHFHTHNTSSAQLATLHAMADAGCDIVDGCFAAFADGTSQPSLNAFLATMEGRPRDPKINYRKLEGLDAYWSSVRDMYSPFESGMKAMTARVFQHQVPGGQYSNMYAQCHALGGDNWDHILQMYADVNMWCGDIVKVTPSSKAVGDIALFLVKQGIEPNDFDNMPKMQALHWPQSAIELARGEMGTPHFGFPRRMQDAILKGQLKPMEGRPGDTLAPEDFEKVKAAMKAEFGKEPTSEDMNAFLMYPGVFRDYMKHLAKVGPLATCLPTGAFFYGLTVHETIEFEVPGPNVVEAEAQANAALPRTKATITLNRVGPLEHDFMRTCEWLVDGVAYPVSIYDPPPGAASYKGPMADPSKKSHVACPLPGVIKTSIKEGAEVKKDDLLFTVVAMKMEVLVRAPADCTILEVCIAVDDEVVDGALLAKLEL
ncbi:pyc [Symbiodinium sp. CCMP2456]|nr:pyc [Symbiodinium sp. CCMP2456]